MVKEGVRPGILCGLLSRVLSGVLSGVPHCFFRFLLHRAGIVVIREARDHFKHE